MKKTVTFSTFCDAFRDAGRNDNFSYEGKLVLFDYLEECEEASGVELELDVVALCCEYSEMCWEEVTEYYSVDLSDCEDDDEKEEAVREYLQDNTAICGESINGFVFANF